MSSAQTTSAIVPRSGAQRADRQVQLTMDFEALEVPPLDACRPADLSRNALELLGARYLLKDPSGQVTEGPDDLFARAALAVAKGERSFGGPSAVQRYGNEFLDALLSLDFVPNSPTLMNAGSELGMLSACFVLPVNDSMESIFDSLKLTALIQKAGGGTGFSFSSLRPKGDLVRSTGGLASGPLSFMAIYNAATEHVRQGGKRRGANMGILRVDHPDILEFVDAKRDGQSLQNFNLSVGLTDEFMEAALSGAEFQLRNPRTEEETTRIPAAGLLKRIAFSAWATGDPGVLYLDTMNRGNPTPALGRIESTNPCGEVPLLPHEACILGSINLLNMVETTGGTPRISWDRLARTTRLAVRFLDDAIEVSQWPHRKISRTVHGNRKVGVGVMGLADMLIRLGIPYASKRGVTVGEKLMSFITYEAWEASRELVAERGVFPNWEGSVYAARQLKVRNATTTSIAPTGSIAIIAGASSSIEPLFALAYRRENILDGQTLTELNPLFVDYARRHGFYSDKLVRRLRETGSLAAIEGVPKKAKRLFETALEIHPMDHLRMQAAFQKHVDNAVSKTINLPQSATEDDVYDIYCAAWQLGLKGVTVYRYGSKPTQVLSVGAESGDEEEDCTGGSCPRCADG